MRKRIAVFLWYIGFFKGVCPVCSRNLVEHRNSENVRSRYTCPNPYCEFNE